MFAFANGITVRAQAYNVVPADSRSGVGGQSFAAVLGGDPRVEAYLYRVLDENLIPRPPRDRRPVRRRRRRGIWR